jgi:hypothetical protein
MAETVPQFRPAITVWEEVSTVIGRPAASDAVTRGAGRLDREYGGPVLSPVGPANAAGRLQE